jgi:hypothetical protein
LIFKSWENKKRYTKEKQKKKSGKNRKEKVEINNILRLSFRG